MNKEQGMVNTEYILRRFFPSTFFPAISQPPSANQMMNREQGMMNTEYPP